MSFENVCKEKCAMPAFSPHKPITIKLKLRLSQIIDVHEIDQIMSCSVWLKQVWIDKRLSWDPKSYGGVNVLYVPYEMIWVPDIVLYNNADSYYNITISTKATLHFTGQVTWEPPAIFKSMCQIDVRWCATCHYIQPKPFYKIRPAFLKRTRKIRHARKSLFSVL
ncbi:unnamed protein product [Strongylus vulgaris]|uniref:Neurotransmitter-gated ion-channel ligand-binding domain-containing protein n=1 Tax=Strongylus vulgaris TaxID=40348 RepID=A0A3P7KEC7_STRVU|nr:unnamed protein product [Strongylus vulgaris]